MLFIQSRPSNSRCTLVHGGLIIKGMKLVQCTTHEDNSSSDHALPYKEAGFFQSCFLPWWLVAESKPCFREKRSQTRLWLNRRSHQNMLSLTRLGLGGRLLSRGSGSGVLRDGSEATVVEASGVVVVSLSWS